MTRIRYPLPNSVIAVRRVPLPLSDVIGFLGDLSGNPRSYDTKCRSLCRRVASGPEILALQIPYNTGWASRWELDTSNYALNLRAEDTGTFPKSWNKTPYGRATRRPYSNLEKSPRDGVDDARTSFSNAHIWPLESFGLF